MEFEETEEERYRREFLEKKYEESRLKKEKWHRNRIRKFYLLKISSVFTCAFSSLLILDYFLPEKQINQTVVDSFRQRTKYSSYRVIKTESLEFSVSNNFWASYSNGDILQISLTPIFNEIKTIVIETPKYQITATPNRSVYIFLLIGPLFVLITSLVMLVKKEFDLAVYAFGSIGFFVSIVLVLSVIF